VGSLFNDLSVFEYDDSVGILDGAQSVGDHHDGFAALCHEFVE
jgi:hypothetical protein